MPSKSKAQHRLMEAVAHGWKKPGGGGPPVSVAQDFVAADKAKGMDEGGEVEGPERHETPGEGIPALTHVTEHEDHFLAHFADGQSAFVGKEGLKPETLAHMQGMAHGGEVIAGGGTTDPEVPSDSEGRPPSDALLKALSDRNKVIEEKQSKADHEKAEGRAEPTTHDQAPVKMADGGTVPDAGMDMVGGPLPIFQQIDPSTLPPAYSGTDAGIPMLLQRPPDAAPLQTTSAQMDAERARGREAQLAQQQADEYARMTGQQSPGAAPTETVPGVFGAPPPHNPALDVGASPPAAQRTAGYGGSGSLGELNKGIAEQQAAVTAEAEAQKQRSAAVVRLMDEQLAQKQALEARQAEQLAAHQRRADDLFNATLNAKIDPNRVWSSMDVGQRIGAGIGILLSGIGVGLAGGPNLALQTIDRTIDRDIDAQKANLESQRSLLAHYLQQGRDMISAQQLAKADLKDMFAAQLTRVSAEFGGQEAAARAQMLGGQIRTSAVGLRQDALGKDFALSQARQQAQHQLEMQRAIEAALHPTGGQPAMHPAMASLLMQGPAKMAEHMVQVPHDQVDSAGLMHPSGRIETRYVFPGLKAEKAAEAIMENRLITEKVSRLKDFVNKHPHGTLSPQESQAAHDLVADLSLSWNKSQENLNRLNEREAEMIQGMVKDPSELHVSGRYAQSINDLLTAVHSKRRAIEDQYLIPQ